MQRHISLFSKSTRIWRNEMCQPQSIEYNVIQQWNDNIMPMRKIYRDNFIKPRLKALKVTAPSTIFLKWTEFQWWMDLW